MAYSVLIISDDPLSRRTLKILARFCDIYELRMDELFSRILSALQGDEEADGGRLVDEGSDEEGDLPEVEDESESAHIFPSEAKPPDWTHLKKWVGKLTWLMTDTSNKPSLWAIDPA